MSLEINFSSCVIYSQHLHMTSLRWESMIRSSQLCHTYMYIHVHTCMGTVASVVYLRCLFNRVNAFNGVLSNINLSCYSISSWIVCGSIVQVEAENVQFQEMVVTIKPSDPYLPVITPFRSEHHSVCVCVRASTYIQYMLLHIK